MKKWNVLRFPLRVLWAISLSGKDSGQQVGCSQPGTRPAKAPSKRSGCLFLFCGTPVHLRKPGRKLENESHPKLTIAHAFKYYRVRLFTHVTLFISPPDLVALCVALHVVHKEQYFHLKIILHHYIEYINVIT